MRTIRRDWLRSNFWKINFPVEVRMSRIALLLLVNVAINVMFMAIYDREFREPLAGLFVGTCLSVLTCYLFLLFTKHKKIKA